MEKPVFADYDNSIINITASLLKYYGIGTDYSSIGILDGILKKNYKNIVLLVFDGMGMDMLINNLPYDSFLRQNTLSEVTSVYPCTTAAAITSLYTCLSPKEHGWLGWSLYFKEFGRSIDVITNNDSITGQAAGETHAGSALMPYATIYEKIYKASGGKVETFSISPNSTYAPCYPNTNIAVYSLEHILEKTEMLCKYPGGKLITSYWYEPDSVMHKTGCYSKESKYCINQINKRLEDFSRKVKDTLIIITADHGQTEIKKEVYINDYPKIEDCLLMPPSIEPRAISFFIKPRMEKEFVLNFNEHFGKDYILFKKEEVSKNNLFGKGTAHKKTDDFTGDYIACAIGSTMIRYKTLNALEKKTYKGHHAGLTKAEMIVPLIIIEK